MVGEDKPAKAKLPSSVSFLEKKNIVLWGFASMYVLRGSEEVPGSPGTRLAYGCEPPCESWESNPGPQHPVLSIT